MKPSARSLAAMAAVTLSLAACDSSGMFGQQNRPTTATQAAAPAAAAASQSAMAPDMVRDIQRTLATKGYAVGAVDGVYGESTQSALQRFQREHSLQASGQIDSQTLAALGLTGQTATAAPSQPQYTPTTRRGGQTSMAEPQQKVSPNMVRDIQQGLENRGYKVGKVDGVWGRQTRQALLTFQKDQNLRASGRIDERTLAALNIGEPSQQTGQLPQNR
jgi:peptidoglycan hydrolase-like protein with peptidoglycan-binding domain